MAVEIFSPGNQDAQISASDEAINHLLLQKDKQPQKQLRLDLRNSGCSGYKYNLEFVDQVEPEDIQIQLSESLFIYVPRMRIAMLKGTEIAYVTEGLNSALKYSNPNADAECGCGESFSLKDPENNQSVPNA